MAEPPKLRPLSGLRTRCRGTLKRQLPVSSITTLNVPSRFTFLMEPGVYRPLPILSQTSTLRPFAKVGLIAAAFEGFVPSRSAAASIPSD